MMLCISSKKTRNVSKRRKNLKFRPFSKNEKISKRTATIESVGDSNCCDLVEFLQIDAPPIRSVRLCRVRSGHRAGFLVKVDLTFAVGGSVCRIATGSTALAARLLLGQIYCDSGQKSSLLLFISPVSF